MATTAETLLKLTIKGVDPSEAQRIASSSTAGVEAAFRESMERQAALYKIASETQNAQARAYAQRELSERQSQATALLGVIKQSQAQEQAMSRAHSAALIEDARRTAEKTREFEESTRGAASAFAPKSGGGLLQQAKDFRETGETIAEYGFVVYEAFKKLEELGEAVAHVTEINNHFKGSIDDLREATGGEISDMDLMIAKNRAAAGNLKLTAEQFGALGGAAKSFADSIGGNVNEALNDLIKGLETGRSKTLQAAGVFLDQPKIFADWAVRIGHAGEQLDDTAKKAALFHAVLKSADEKLVESGVHAEGFAEQFQKVKVILSNAWDQMLLGFGVLVSKTSEWLMIGLPNAVHVAVAKVKDIVPGFGSGNEARAREAWAVQSYDAKVASEAESRKAIEEAQARLAGDQSVYDPTTGFGGVLKTKTGGSTVKFDFFQTILGHSQDEVISDMTDQVRDIHEKWNKELQDTFGDPEQFTAGERAQIFAGNAVAGDKSKTPALAMLAAMGFSTDDSSEDDLIKAELDRKFEKAMAALDTWITAQKDAVAEDIAKTHDENTKALGVLSVFFGEDFLSTSREEMDAAEQILYDGTQQMNGVLKSVGNQLASGYGAALAHSIGEGKNLKAALQDTTHAVLISLSEQAFVKSLMWGAESLGDLAMGNFAGAGLAAAASASFAAVGVAAGIGARAIPSSSGSASAGSTPTASSGSFSSGPQSSAIDNSTGPVTLSVYVAPGGEAEAGRSIVAALTAWSAQTGKDLSHLVGKN